VLRGGEPVLVGTNLDLKSLGTDDRHLPTVRELAKGYVNAAKTANVAIINGEIVQMGSLMHGIGDFPYHWGAACVWFGRKDRLFTGREIQVGDAIVALRESGFRCNGYSLVRKIFFDAYGEEWHAHPFEGSTVGLHALLPSTIYSKFVVSVHGGFSTEGSCEIHGVAHITGGGIKEKVSRMLRPSGLGVELTDLFAPPKIMTHAQELGQVSDRDAYGTWNMGQGMLLVSPNPEALLAEAKRQGYEAQVAGRITDSRKIRVISKGTENPGQELLFDVQ
jgi:phosphoribosylformylglycinamidine cyclo-ligase